MTENPYPSEWLRGGLGLAVLRVIADGPTYGYAIALALADQGFGEIKGGTLYPLLGRFEESGDVSAEWREGDGGPGRKYYRLTESGRRLLHDRGRMWHGFARHMSGFLTTMPTERIER